MITLKVKIVFFLESGTSLMLDGSIVSLGDFSLEYFGYYISARNDVGENVPLEFEFKIRIFLVFKYSKFKY